VIVLALLLHPAPLAADDTGRSLESALLTNGVEHPEVHAEEEAIALVYRALAGGPAGPEEVMFWSRRISDRGGRLELAWMLAQETLVSQHITTLYRETLGREPHPDELAYWTRHASGPGRLADTAILILSSEEARTRAVSNNAYVAMLYRNALGRDVDEDWLRYWVGNIERVGAADAARALWNAPEARGRRITDAYRDVLLREADAGGLLYWLSTGYDEPVISAVLAASDEIWRPTLPGELPFVFPGTILHSTILGERNVTFIVSFTERPSPERFCAVVETGVREGGVHVETPCAPEVAWLVGSYRDETLLLAATGRDTFTLTIGAAWG
jgi:hypothetical protein